MGNSESEIFEIVSVKVVLDFPNVFFWIPLPDSRYNNDNTLLFQKNLFPEFIMIFESIFFWNKKVLVSTH